MATRIWSQTLLTITKQLSDQNCFIHIRATKCSSWGHNSFLSTCATFVCWLYMCQFSSRQLEAINVKNVPINQTWFSSNSATKFKNCHPYTWLRKHQQAVNCQNNVLYICSETCFGNNKWSNLSCLGSVQSVNSNTAFRIVDLPQAANSQLSTTVFSTFGPEIAGISFL